MVSDGGSRPYELTQFAVVVRMYRNQVLFQLHSRRKLRPVVALEAHLPPASLGLDLVLVIGPVGLLLLYLPLVLVLVVLVVLPLGGKDV